MFDELYGKKYQLHWASAVITTLNILKEILIPVLIIFAINMIREGGVSGSNVFPLVITFFVVFVLLIFTGLSSILSWMRFEYWFEDGEIRVEHGIFVRKKRYVPFGRIQSVDSTESVLHRLFGLVKIHIETAGGSGEGEVVLPAVSKSAAAAIEAVIEDGKRRARMQEGPEELMNGLPFISVLPIIDTQIEEVIDPQPKVETTFQMKTKELLLLATTSGGIGVILSGVFLFLMQFSEFIPVELIYGQVQTMLKTGIIVVATIVAVVFFIAWILSVAMTYISYYAFTVQKDEENIIITRGLLEKKKVTVPLTRVQGIEVIQNPFRQLIGYETVVLHSAGSVSGDGEKLNLFPLVRSTKREQLLMNLFPTMEFPNPEHRLPKRSRPYFRRVHYNWLLPIIVALIYFFPPYGWLSLLLLPLHVAHSAWRYHSASFQVIGKQVILRHRGVLSLYTMYTTRRRVQSSTIRQSIFQERGRVGTLMLKIKSGSWQTEGRVPHMDIDEARQIFYQLPLKEKK